MAEWVGYWEIDAPVTPEEQHEDMKLLTAIQLPEGMTLSHATVWVHGREWYWTRVSAYGFPVQDGDRK